METPSVNSEKKSSDFSYAPTTIIAEHYRVERELGRGGMATVYLCTDTRTDEKVAIKVLRPELGSAVIVERFLREISFASELDHPQIPKVLGSGVVDGVPYYVMSYVEGEPLRRLIDREKQLPLPEALRIACEVIKPTAYAHKRGIVHRDLKPENIFISDQGIFVLDFGISRAIIESGGDRLTSTGIGVGTPAYMSPEQALGDRNLDVRTDIYSLGCVLYEMIGGLPPFVGPTAQVVISRRFAGNPPPLRELRDGVPESVEYAIERALAKSPADRWSSAEDFGVALNACATGELRFTTSSQRYWWRRPNRRAAMITIAAGVIVASAFAWSAAFREPVAHAQRAIAEWNFPEAKAELLRAVARRPNDPRASLWLAQSMMLNRDSASEWRSFAEIAYQNRTGLSDAEQQTAKGLVALSADPPANDCSDFARLARSEATDTPLGMSSNVGYADCLYQDHRVVPDPASPSGYRFRVSLQFVDSLYEALLARHQTSPGAYRFLLPRIENVLRTDRGVLRLGILDGPKRLFLLAQPSLSGDTIAYFPSPPEPSTPWHTVDPDGAVKAVARNRQRMRAFAIGWTKSAPDDPLAHETLAKFLELTGELTGGEVSALTEIHAARSLYPAGKDAFFSRVRLANAEIRVFVRQYRFANAAALADTVLSWKVPPIDDPAADSVGDLLLSIAALRGRTSRVIEMEHHIASHSVVRLATGEVVSLPGVLATDQIALENYAAFGGSADTVVALVARLKKNAVANIPSHSIDPLLTALFTRPLWLAAPVIGTSAAAAELRKNGDPFSRAIGLAARGEKHSVRVLLDSVSRTRVDFAPGEITMDVVFAEAWLRAQVGDTTGAVSALDNVLRGLPAALPSILRDATVASGLVRAMALRASLAAKSNEPDVAKKWATAVLQLWGSGDPIVASTVSEMRKIVPNVTTGAENANH